MESNEINEREVENLVGIEIYSTPEISGIGGIYKNSYKDFIVKEITKDGKTLEIKDDFPSPNFLEESKDKYTTFNLIKINKDTFEALRELSNGLKINRNLISYAGLKDKCSISVQKVSIRGNFVKELRKLKIRDSFYRCITPTKKYVKLGENWGNNFTIVIRNIEDNQNLKIKLDKLISFLSESGFPNYYGLQRFGTYRPNSHKIGMHLLEGDYFKAFNEFVSAKYSTESSQMQVIRSHAASAEHLEDAFNKFPESLIYEKKLMKYLLDNPNDYEGSFKTISDDLINLMISAFQSYIFNHMISLRVKRGIPLAKPVKGDIIGILEDDNSNITQVKYEYGGKGGIYDKYLDIALEQNRAVVVAPIIGYNTNLDDFPLLKSLFKEITIQNNINTDIFQSKLLYEREFKGSFRPIITKPIGLNITKISDDDLFPNKKKVKLEFSLPKGTYATMVLREIMK